MREVDVLPAWRRAIHIARPHHGLMERVNPRGSYLLRLNEEQRRELNRLAADEGMPIQHFIELRLFGHVKPRTMGRPRRDRNQPQLPVQGHEEVARRTA